MKYDRFLTDSNFSGWLVMNCLESWVVAMYEEKHIMLLYHLDEAYGMAIEVNDRLQGHGYDIITDIAGLPSVQFEIIPENNTMSRVLNEEDFRGIALNIAQRIDDIMRS